jgi:exportin-2 (importin alpha re-exporter)
LVVLAASFRYQEQSKELMLELKYVLELFQQPFMAVFENMAAAVDAPGMTEDNLRLIFETLRLMARIFFSLNWQDLPEFFEDSMPRWTQHFGKLLSTEYPLQSGSDDEPGPVEVVQAAIVEVLNIYATKYEEEFQPYLQPFAQTVWQLLIRTGRETKFDNLATTSIQFLTTVVSKPAHAHMFNEQILQQFVESIVVPNLTVR